MITACGALLPRLSSAPMGYWPQLKLVTLAHAAARFGDIHHHVLVHPYGNDISAEYGKTAFVQLDDGTSIYIPDLARTDLMLLASISHLCWFSEYPGAIACRLITEALTVAVKMPHQIDTNICILHYDLH